MKLINKLAILFWKNWLRHSYKYNMIWLLTTPWYEAMRAMTTCHQCKHDRLIYINYLILHSQWILLMAFYFLPIMISIDLLVGISCNQVQQSLHNNLIWRSCNPAYLKGGTKKKLKTVVLLFLYFPYICSTLKKKLFSNGSHLQWRQNCWRNDATHL